MTKKDRLYGEFQESRHAPGDPLSEIEQEVVDQIRRRIRIRSGIGYVTYPVSPDGQLLQSRVNIIRSLHKKGRLHHALIAALEAIPGWSWSSINQHSRRFAEILRRYIEQHGWMKFTSEIVIEGERVGFWLTCVRAKYRKQGVNPWLKAELEAIPGFEWDNAREIKARRYSDRMLNRNIEALRKAYEEMPDSWTTTTNNARYGSTRLLTAISYFRAKYKKKELEAEVIRELESMRGWSWDPVDDLQQKYVALLQDLAKRKGGLPQLEHNEMIAGNPVGSWIGHANRMKRQGKLSEKLRKQLEAIPGWLWKETLEERDRKKVALLREYLEENDLRDLKKNRMFKGVNLYSWVGHHRHRHRHPSRTGKGSPEWLVLELEKLRDWSWTPSEENQVKKRSPQRHWGQVEADRTEAEE